MPLGAEGEFALVRNQMEKGRELAGQPVKRGSMAHDHDAYMILADAAAQLRDAEGLKRYVPLLRELAERDQHKLYLGIAHRAQGVLNRLAGDYEEAEGQFQKAVGLFKELATRWQLGRTFYEVGEVRREQADDPGARDQFERALREFQFLQAIPEIERTRAALAQLR